MLKRATATVCFAMAFFILSTAAQTGGSPANNASNQPYVRPDKETREKRWLIGMFGPFSIAGDAFTAGIATWDNKPPEWHKSWNGFGKRFASNLGMGVIKGTTAYGIEEAFKLDSYYYRSPKHTPPGSRLKNAIVSAFTARTPSGRRVFGFPRITGSYVSSIVATEAWYPNRLGIRDGIRGGTYSVGADILSNIFTEFFHK